MRLIRTPTAPHIAKFGVHHDSPPNLFFMPITHKHLPKTAQLNNNKFRTPKPPWMIEEQTLDQLTMWNLNSWPSPPHKKSCWIFSIWLATPTRRGNRDMKYVGNLESVLIIRVTLPHFDKYILFQLANQSSYLFNNTIPNKLFFL